MHFLLRLRLHRNLHHHHHHHPHHHRHYLNRPALEQTNVSRPQQPPLRDNKKHIFVLSHLDLEPPRPSVYSIPPPPPPARPLPSRPHIHIRALGVHPSHTSFPPHSFPFCSCLLLSLCDSSVCKLLLVANLLLAFCQLVACLCIVVVVHF